MLLGRQPSFVGLLLRIAATQRLPAAAVRTTPSPRKRIEEQQGLLRTIWCVSRICEPPPQPSPLTARELRPPHEYAVQQPREPPPPRPDASRWRSAPAGAVFSFELPRLERQC